MTTPPPPPSGVLTPAEQAKLDLDTRRLELDERKQALEESFPRKWGAVTFGAMATFSVAMITSGMGVLQSCAQREDARAAAAAVDAEKLSAATIARAQRDKEDDRLAVDVYFKYVDKGGDTPAEKKRALLVGNLAGSDRVIQYFRDAARNDITSIVQTNVAKGLTPAEASSGLPDLIANKPAAQYAPGDFVGYVQYPPGANKLADAARGVIGGLGMIAPSAQQIVATKIPNKDEIRIYRADHQAVANQLAIALQKATGRTFTVQDVGRGRSLPNGVMEIWIGKAPTP